MAKQMSAFRLDPMTIDLLDTMVESLGKQGIETNKTVVLTKAVRYFAREVVLEREVLQALMDKHLMLMAGLEKE